jgi:predicted DNA-binding protein (MmcQ/YjbR family)
MRMTLKEYRDYCREWPYVTEEFPFDETTLVHKVLGKMFALGGTDPFVSLSLKGDPEDLLAYREAFASVQPGYHLNKRHWITVEIGGDVPEHILRSWIKDSYNLVVQKMKKADREKVLGTLGKG